MKESARARRRRRHALSCEGKKRFATREEATRDLRQMRDLEITKGAVNTYQCAFCSGFHIGATPADRRPDR